MDANIRLSLIEDELLVRRLLQQSLQAQQGVRLVHSVESVKEASLVIEPGTTDVAIIDVNLADGDGISLGSWLQSRDPNLGVLLLSGRDSMGAFMLAQRSAAKPWSYLSKRSSFALTTLTRAIKAAADGEQVIDPYLIQNSVPRTHSAVSNLSPTQYRVLSLVAQGLSNEAIGETAGIKVRTVENHLLAIYRQLGMLGDGRNRRVMAVLAFLEQTSRQG